MDTKLPVVRFRDVTAHTGLGHRYIRPKIVVKAKDYDDVNIYEAEFTDKEKAEMASSYPKGSWQHVILKNYGRLTVFCPAMGQ